MTYSKLKKKKKYGEREERTQFVYSNGVRRPTHVKITGENFFVLLSFLLICFFFLSPHKILQECPSEDVSHCLHTKRGTHLRVYALPRDFAIKIGGI